MPLENNGRPHPRIADRRTALLSLFATAVMVGCGKEKSGTPDQTAKPRSDVPLRIVLAGSETDAESIRLAWSMTAEQPLQIETVDIAQPDFSDLIMRADVAILPQQALGGIVHDGAATTLVEALLEKYDQQYGKPYPAVEESLGRYGGETWGLGVGAKVFALLATDSQLQCETWADYHDWVKQLGGKAAEPLAKGWAATSFLNRCALTFSRRWLFNRMTMQPEITGSDYVDALEQMRATASLYTTPAKNPTQIWRGMVRGELQGAIGYEVPIALSLADDSPVDPSPDALESDRIGNDTDQFDVSVFDCPMETEINRLWFGPHTPFVCISSGCRQTDVSKQFVGWLSGGERISSVREQTDRFSQTRASMGNDGGQSESAYSRWLAGRLQTRQIVPGLILPSAQQYHDALDQQVIACLSGKRSAAEAMAAAAEAWEAITEKVGRQKQTAAWKRTLGFGA